MRSAPPLLLLLHGLGGNRHVWQGLGELLPQRWPGDWLAPDLPGHGAAAPLPRYSFGAMAAALAERLPRDRPVAVLGHSLGGALALTLASGWFGVRVMAACGLGIKVRWSAAELAKAGELAAAPARSFGTREEAVRRWLRVSGLTDLVAAGSPAARAGVTGGDGAWRLALDQGAFGVGAPDMPGLLGAARADVVLAAGEHDPMCPVEHLWDLRADHVVLPGLGHNAHVEDPAALLPVLDRLVSEERG
ncbi:alpha/beta fold hydrolase [Prauserella shujinwangii]|uniref:alpha/beta fold hydrolase n=1 Tax=Prauserella shujinwangii TaxID=1453103 RepID=UPI003CCBAC46